MKGNIEIKAVKETTAPVVEGQAEIVPIFQTKDINLAAYLKTLGYKLRECVKEKDRVLFGFEDKDFKKREKDMYDFYNDVGGFQTYTNSWKDLKSLLHSIGGVN